MPLIELLRGLDAVGRQRPDRPARRLAPPPARRGGRRRGRSGPRAQGLLPPGPPARGAVPLRARRAGRRGGRSRRISTPWCSPPSRTRSASSRTRASAWRWSSAPASSPPRSRRSSSASSAPPSAAPPCGRSSTACRTATARSCRRCCAWRSGASWCGASPRCRSSPTPPSDLPPDLAAAHGIDVVPLTVAFGAESFRDRVDLQPGQFYGLLKSEEGPPGVEPAGRGRLRPPLRRVAGPRPRRGLDPPLGAAVEDPGERRQPAPPRRCRRRNGSRRGSGPRRWRWSTPAR